MSIVTLEDEDLLDERHYYLCLYFFDDVMYTSKGMKFIVNAKRLA
jgi:hypothetical protein